ncbi:MAG TPA: hypothetical protein VHZ95_15730, partial [Polyangiales bacterium]|nr:hypothetical protein [Polyangiales bacterium]
MLRSSLRVPLARPSADLPFRSPFVRLVGDATDLQAHGAESRALLVALRDRVVARYGEGPNAVERTVRVGAPGEESGPASARQARLVVHILRRAPGASPVIGRDEASALQLMREQVKAANQIWLQCDFTFGSPDEVSMELVDPPPPTLLAVGNDDGLPARGDGAIRFLI